MFNTNSAASCTVLGCQQICISGPKGTAQCACKDGWYLGNDNISCTGTSLRLNSYMYCTISISYKHAWVINQRWLFY